MLALRSASLALLVVVEVPCTWAQDRYRVSQAERAACQDDAVKLCSGAYPDEDALLACMKLNQSRLTAGCRPVFLDGLRRRVFDESRGPAGHAHDRHA